MLLLVEDESLSDLIAETLSEEGHQIFRVGDGSDLVAAVARHHCDAIVVDLDVRTHGVAGVVAQLRRAAPSSTIVVLLPCGAAPDAHPMGCDVALEKPTRLAALRAAVQGIRKMP